MSTNLEIVKCSPDDLPNLLSGLSSLLADSVEAGANVNFVLPFTTKDAEGFWTSRAYPALTSGAQTLWIAKNDEAIVGCVMLITQMMPNQSHRVEVTKLLVHPEARRQRIGQKLMQKLIEEATKLDKKLITLDTVTNSPAQRLYEQAGFEVAGVIPDFAYTPDKAEIVPTTYMFKRL